METNWPAQEAVVLEFCEKLCFPPEASRALAQCWTALAAQPQILAALYEARDSLFLPGDESYLQQLQALAQRAGVHHYTLDMVFLILCAGDLREKYRQWGLSEALYWDVVEDLRYKLLECKKVYDLWGTASCAWYKGFYTGRRFKLGRLQYEKSRFPFDDYHGLIQKGDLVYNCHIPSQGPLRRELVLDSLQSAYQFYRRDEPAGPMCFVCNTWLLYPAHYPLFPENGNLRAFYDLFDVIGEKQDPANRNFWRIFSRPYDAEKLDQAAQDTALQRSFLAYLKSGRCMGDGFGVIVYDGEKKKILRPPFERAGER